MTAPLPPKIRAALVREVDEAIVDNKLLSQAIALAAQYHDGQERRGTKQPYIVHPVRVAQIVRKAPWNSPLKGNVSRLECVLAAIFHDLLEDTDITEDILAKFMANELMFNKWGISRVLCIVKELTQDRSLPWKKRRAQMLEHCGEMTIGARLVKFADRLDNMRDMKGMNDSFKKRYCDETRVMLEKMEGTCLSIEKELLELVVKYEISLQ